MKIFFLVFLIATYAQAKSFRIVSLNPTLTEVLFDLGLGDQIVGTTTFSDYPELAKKIPRIGSYSRPNIEKIMTLEPTDVLAFSEGNPEIKDALLQSHLNTHVFENSKLDEFPALVSRLAKLFNKEVLGKKILDRWKKKLNQIENLKLKNKKIMIEISFDPIFIAGKNTFLSEIFQKCGLRNIFLNLDGFKQVSEENIMAKKPDIVLILNQSKNILGFEHIKSHWENNPATSHAIILNGPADELSRLGPRLPSTVLQICAHSGLK